MKHQWEYKALTKHSKCEIAWCARCGCIQDGDDIIAPFGEDGDGLGIVPCSPATAMAIRDIKLNKRT